MENINHIIRKKLKLLRNSEYTLKSLYELIHENGERCFCEYLEGYQIKYVTYNECNILCKKTGKFINKNLKLKKGEYVGLLMENSLLWITSFWGLLMAGYKPVLLNDRFSKDMLESIEKRLNIKKIIVSDSKYEGSKYLKIDLKEIKKEETLDDATWSDELALTTTATSLNIKICIYKGSDLTYQVLNAEKICKTNPMMKKHYKGKLKQLAFLPFYHVFGLIATYFWFATFGRSFVFLNNYSPDTIINTIKKHKVTHFFAVPMVWHTIYNEIIRAVESKDKETKEKFYKGVEKGIRLQSTFPRLGKKLCHKLFKEVQDEVFGDSIQFLISGGGYINNDALRTINGIGYPLYVGYGMSEIGISSVELRMPAKYRVKGTIGKPFTSYEYKIEDDILYVKGKSLCSKILTMDSEYDVDHDAWFKTNDIAKHNKDGSYIVEGRNDDVYINSNGEKINPDFVESLINLKQAKNFCVTCYDKKLSLIIEINQNSSDIKLKKVFEETSKELEKYKKYIEKVYYTYDALSPENAIKVSRTLLLKNIKDKKIKLLSYEDLKKMKSKDIENIDESLNGIKKEVRKTFSDILNKDIKEIKDESHFIFDLGGSSLDYLSLLCELEKIYDIKFDFKEESPSTVNDFATFISNLIENNRR